MNVGPGGAVVMFLVTALGMGLVIVSMAEMASMQVDPAPLYSMQLTPCIGHLPRAANTTGLANSHLHTISSSSAI